VSAIRGVSIQIGASSGVKILVPFTSNGHENNHVGMDHSEDVSSSVKLQRASVDSICWFCQGRFINVDILAECYAPRFHGKNLPASEALRVYFLLLLLFFLLLKSAFF
jgi:hypothetical protein